jgi:hypothetical protein
MNELQLRSKIKMHLPIIECEGIQFCSLKEAGEHFGCSDERIRQKLKDDKHPSYIYLF